MIFLKAERIFTPKMNVSVHFVTKYTRKMMMAFFRCFTKYLLRRDLKFMAGSFGSLPIVDLSVMFQVDLCGPATPGLQSGYQK